MVRGLWMGLFALVSALAAPAAAQAPALHDRPVLVLDAGVHTAMLWAVDVDGAGRVVASASEDRTVRLWSTVDGRLLRTIRLPVGHGSLGEAYSVAISPDGDIVAVGGWTRGVAGAEQIYLFDARTGAMVARIGDLPNNVVKLTFSRDGARLAATFGGSGGLIVYDRDAGWAEDFRDMDYRDRAYGAAFAIDGRLATASDDGHVRIYPPEGGAPRVIETDERYPFGVSFSPDGRRLAVGFAESPTIRVFDADTMHPRPPPDVSGLQAGDLAVVGWSTDGETLYGGGGYQVGGKVLVFAWDERGSGQRRTLFSAESSIVGIQARDDGAVVVASAEPAIAMLAPGGSRRWGTSPIQMDARGQRDTLAVSHDGAIVRFGFDVWGERPATFDMRQLRLDLDPPIDPTLAVPDQDSLPILGWVDARGPTLAGAPLPLGRMEMSRSLAIHPDRRRFVLGADWSFRAFDAAGTELWNRDIPSVVWAVNISGDGRLVVAAYGDGTIRWHRMEDGAELLAFFPFEDGRNWVAWEPDGRFAATPGAMGALRWHVNRGWDEAPVALPANEVPHSFRPGVIARVLHDGGTMQAVYAAEETERRAAIRRLTGAAFAPGAQLHVLTIGVSDYALDALDLDYADTDAADLRAALATQSDDLWPYQRGFTMTLRNEEATGLAILHQLETIGARVASAPSPSDLVVIHFSGHGTIAGDGSEREFYLLPHDADTRTPARLRHTGLSARELHGAITGIAEHARVLLLVDACRSGAAGESDADLLRRTLAGRGVTVITSSSAAQSSWEDPAWRNGAFTEVTVEALGGAADADRNGMISVEELSGYVAREVPALTGGRQTPAVEIRFSGNLFASGM